MAKGIPIRLVQENGNLIELDATNMVLSTTRKVGGSALPWTGSRRIGMDWNVNSAMINIQGIIADDRVGTSARAHSASINFGLRNDAQVNRPRQWDTSDNLSQLLGVELELQSYSASTIGEFDSITFTNTASAGGTAYSATGGAGSTPTVLVNTSDGTSEQIATAVAAYINARLSSKYSASVDTAKKSDGSRNLSDASCQVNVTMATSPSAFAPNIGTRIVTPRFKKVGTSTDSSSGSYFKHPVINLFSGGTIATLKSAGDKAQDLYGVINNSTRRSKILSRIAAREGKQTARDNNDLRDYIVGIQIPYNSTLKAEGGEKYVARNFFMPTGFYYGKEKTSEGNDLPASVDLDLANELTGIQGAVQKFDITYDAGESVYNFNMIFAPIDNMILS